MDSINLRTTGKILPSDPQQSEEFDQALVAVYSKYISGEPLTRRELTRLVNATMRVMAERGVPSVPR